MTKLVLNIAVAAFVMASAGLTVLRHRRSRVRVARRGLRAVLRVGAAMLLAGSVAQASAAEMDMPGMPGMKMDTTRVAVAPSEPDAVNINNFAFAPKELTVAVGTTVTWTNKDEEPHTVVTPGGGPAVFKSAALDSGDKFSFTFTKPGTYRYFCSVHPFMTGTVIVK